jgi:competence protein ComEA
VVVHVAGEVRRPGVQTLPAGSRVVDAVAAAGGALPRADLDGLNLARPLTDGEQVLVPRPTQRASGAVSAPADPADAASAGAPGPAGPAPPSGPTPSTPVNLNTADLAALDALPGIGPVLADRIVAWRTEFGPFVAVEELLEVSGIGPSVLADLRPLVTV